MCSLEIRVIISSPSSVQRKGDTRPSMIQMRGSWVDVWWEEQRTFIKAANLFNDFLWNIHFSKNMQNGKRCTHAHFRVVSFARGKNCPRLKLVNYPRTHAQTNTNTQTPFLNDFTRSLHIAIIWCSRDPKNQNIAFSFGSSWLLYNGARWQS